MSHFSVMVIGDDIEKQLAPYAEFECTGEDNGYVQNIDKLAEAVAEYEGYTYTRWKDPFGRLHEPWDEKFYRKLTPDEQAKVGDRWADSVDGQRLERRHWSDGEGYTPRIRVKPDGYEEIEVKASDLQPFLTFIEEYYGAKPLLADAEPDLDGEHKFGWVRADAQGNVLEYINRTNPSSHWDWWVLGGRWSGFFLLKPDHTSERVIERDRFSDDLGSRNNRRFFDGRATNQAKKGDIDWEAMRARARQEAYESYDKALTEKDVRMWDFVYGIKLNAAAKEKQRIFAETKPKHDEWQAWWSEITRADYETREEYAERRAARAGMPFALVKDGEWFEKGSMGWWGIVSDEQDEEVWAAKVRDLLDGLPDDTLISIKGGAAIGSTERRRLPKPAPVQVGLPGPRVPRARTRESSLGVRRRQATRRHARLAGRAGASPGPEGAERGDLSDRRLSVARASTTAGAWGGLALARREWTRRQGPPPAEEAGVAAPAPALARSVPRPADARSQPAAGPARPSKPLPPGGDGRAPRPCGSRAGPCDQAGRGSPSCPSQPRWARDDASRPPARAWPRRSSWPVPRRSGPPRP